MFKKIAGLFLAAAVMCSSAAITASAAEAEDDAAVAAADQSGEVSADGSSEVSADASSEVEAGPSVDTILVCAKFLIFISPYLGFFLGMPKTIYISFLLYYNINVKVLL